MIYFARVDVSVYKRERKCIDIKRQFLCVGRVILHSRHSVRRAVTDTQVQLTQA